MTRNVDSDAGVSSIVITSSNDPRRPFDEEPHLRNDPRSTPGGAATNHEV